MLDFCQLRNLRASFVVSLIFLVAIVGFSPIVHGESARAYLFITPPMYIATKVGEIFDIAVNISNVENLRSCGLTITYNTSLLDVVKVIKGDFFPKQAIFKFEKNEPYGFVTVNISLLESDPPLNGDGTLLQLTFEVAKAPNTCIASTLKLDQIQLYNHGLEPIDHKFVSGIFFWRSMQPDPPDGERLLDLYTQKAGKGPSELGGYFAVGELVYLTSYVTYNNWPVQKGLLAFEVRNPSNQTMAVLYGETDENGFGQIDFRIPELQESVGLWTAICTVDIACEVVWDTISFWVFYIPVPVGGYTFPIERSTIAKPLIPHLALIAVLMASFIVIRQKVSEKAK